MDKAHEDMFLKGVGIIIDDQASIAETTENRLVQSIMSAGIPMVTYDDIPDVSVIDSLGNISFIILDWDFTKLPIGDSEIHLGDELGRELKRTIISFLKVLLEKVFVPVFVITGQNFGDVKAELEEDKIICDQKPSRIMLKTKSEVQDYDSLKNSVIQWLKETPSAYALKIWENKAVLAKNQMFLDLYNSSPYWVNVVLKTLKEDSKDNKKVMNHSFNELLNNIFVNRMDDGLYHEIEISNDCVSEKDEIKKVLQGGRYIIYNEGSLPNISYVGDLYKKKDQDEYWLNIRAQCDLIRQDDPILYLIPGKVFDVSRIAKHPRIKISKENDDSIIIIDQETFHIKELDSYNKKARGEFNSKMQRFASMIMFNNGDIIEKKDHSIIPCIADKLLLEFDFAGFKTKKKTEFETEAARIGRLIPPYITKVQNAFASYMIRTGLMPTPKELLDSKDS